MQKIEDTPYEFVHYFNGIENAAKEWLDSRKYEPLLGNLMAIEAGEIKFPRRRYEVMPEQIGADV